MNRITLFDNDLSSCQTDEIILSKEVATDSSQEQHARCCDLQSLAWCQQKYRLHDHPYHPNSDAWLHHRQDRLEIVNHLLGARRLIASVNRQAPSITVRQRLRLTKRFQDEADAAVVVWSRIWYLVSSICLTHLWIERNDAVFKGERTSVPQSISRYWEVGIRQLTVLAKREQRGVDTVVQGALLHAGIDLFNIEPGVFSETRVESHETLPDPVLLSWLRSFQTSCT